MRLLVLLSLFPLLGVQSRVLFPEELVSFLSFVYSVIPPFKIGQDSRIGAGFRVGPNADFQILLELGPQSETQSLGPDGSSTRDARAPRPTLLAGTNRDTKAPLAGTNRRKSLKGKKNTFDSKNKTLTENKIQLVKNNFNESSTEGILTNSSGIDIEPKNENSTEIST